MSSTLRRYWPTAAVALVLSLGIGGLGGALTDLGDWYQNLTQPAWKPPDWAFGPAWTSIFILCAAAISIAWVHAPTQRAKRQIIIVFAINAILNLLWSALFFVFKMPLPALVEIVPLWLSILACTIVCWRIRPLAGVCLMPYLVWVAFASTVNYGVVVLN
ncbi:MAG: TspO/MBR family protein [Pseudomonadota bacterium]